LEVALGKKMTELKTKCWLEILPSVVKIYNLSYHYSTKKAPFEVMFGQKPNLTYKIPGV
jgi:hypothetical protein